MKPTPSCLSRELRTGTNDFLSHRRTTVALTLVGMASLSVIALYQLGLLKCLPEPPLPGLDAEKVNGSAEAYKLLHTPDAILGLGSYAATLGLAATGDANRADNRPWLPLALLAKAGADAVQAAFLTARSWRKFRAFSLYSLVDVLTVFLKLPSVLPEASAALGHVGFISAKDQCHE